MSDEIIVVAIGGNPLSKRKRTWDSQFAAIKDTAKAIATLAKNGTKIVITHGNGPQVGDFLLRNECAKEFISPLPLHACVAQTQGMLGAMIQAALHNNLGKGFKIANIVTKVSVSPNDPAFKNPTKPVGPEFSEDEFHRIKKLESSAIFREIRPKKYQRIVPSPEPISILELNAIKKLIDDGHIVIACGGGGVPVTIRKKIDFVDAVIDKDLTSGILADRIGASIFVNLTNVDGVYKNFGSTNKKLLRKIHVDKISELFEEGHFEEGSMGPKVKSAIKFSKKTGKNAVIASIKNAKKALELKSGTIIYK